MGRGLGDLIGPAVPTTVAIALGPGGWLLVAGCWLLVAIIFTITGLLIPVALRPSTTWRESQAYQFSADRPL
jgi:hypothetical protein